MKNNRDDLSHAGDPLHKAETLTDNAITLAHKNKQEALGMLAEATQYQNVTPESLCSTIAKLCRLLEKLDK